jgi:hypothetical protein
VPSVHKNLMQDVNPKLTNSMRLINNVTIIQGPPCRAPLNSARCGLQDSSWLSTVDVSSDWNYIANKDCEDLKTGDGRETGDRKVAFISAATKMAAGF